ncbi:MerR family transcriptional regulator [Neokomagataea thailandica]|uniref:MerR family transcriptional regulator n=1 Tax=Neokomagataea tanensis NBRC 106556 TaxID=1223519 RepID=A0ABQ0QG05_9PROT|nr:MULTISPECIES: MerR family transcriptional regulator [Neokomagataea]GBR43401.1 MerR family transcriptional regulator [Neokomagataea tanensis NBRC 106556]
MPTHNALLTIGEFTKAASTTPRTLRHFEALGLLRSKRAENGRRLYDKQAITAFSHIITLKKAGFTLREIQKFLEQPLEPDSILKTQITLLENQQRATENALDTLRSLHTQREKSSDGTAITIQDLCQLLRQTTHTLDKKALEPLLNRHVTQAEKQHWEATADTHFPNEERDFYALKWENLIKRIDQARLCGIRHDSPEAAAFVKEWLALQEPLQTALGRDLWSKTAALYQDLYNSLQAQKALFSAETLSFIQAASDHLKAVEHPVG